MGDFYFFAVLESTVLGETPRGLLEGQRVSQRILSILYDKNVSDTLRHYHEQPFKPNTIYNVHIPSIVLALSIEFSPVVQLTSKEQKKKKEIK